MSTTPSVNPHSSLCIAYGRRGESGVGGGGGGGGGGEGEGGGGKNIVTSDFEYVASKCDRCVILAEKEPISVQPRPTELLLPDNRGSGYVSSGGGVGVDGAGGCSSGGSGPGALEVRSVSTSEASTFVNNKADDHAQYET